VLPAPRHSRDAGPRLGLPVLLVLAVTASACSASTHSGALVAASATTPVATASPPSATTSAPVLASSFASEATTQPPSADSCAIYEKGADARVEFSGQGAQSTCTRSAASLSSGGNFWTLEPQSASRALSLICVMSEGHETAQVSDSGYKLDGSGVCASFLQNGWREDTGAEQSAAAGVASAAAQASSAAAAQAQQQQLAAAQQQQQKQLAAAEQAVADATSQLQDQTALTTDVAKMANDLGTANTDLAKTRTDAKAGPGDNCYNVGQVVGYDAANVVGYDAQNTISYDAHNALVYDLNNALAEEQTLQSALSTLNGYGVTTPSSATAAIAAANSGMAKATTTANRYIDQANADVVEAYAVANAMATGTCAGDGPGDPPAAVTHVQVTS